VRALYTAGTACIVAFLSTIAWQSMAYRLSQPVSIQTHTTPVSPQPATSGRSWFQATKPYCNSVEVETRLQSAPPPEVSDGTGWMAACYALAGKIDAARVLIHELPSGDRGRAAGIVFQVGHPVADAGDDESAGPMMELVLEFWPQNYMARYHAGMSAYILGQHARAADHLARFLEDYHQNDGWTRNARTVLSRLEAS
jgi:thioredoxin-like negative regulator of GroEL